MADEIQSESKSDENSGVSLNSRQVRLVQAIADFQMALSAIDFMTDLEDNQSITRIDRRRFRCFEDAAVIAYGRAFSNAQGLPFLAFKHLELSPSADESKLHKRLMERRHKVVAHSDAERQRILFATEMFEADRMVMLPHMDFDDALSFYAERWQLIEWLRRLIHSASAVLFRQVQGMPPIRFVRDHLNAGEL